MTHVAADYAQPLRWIVPYFTLHFLGIIGLSALLLTFLFADGVRRDATLHSLLLVSLVYEWTASAVFLSGTLFAGKEPSFRLALFNGAFVPGSTPAAAGAALAMVVRILSRIISSQGRWRAFADAKLLMIVLLAGPWVVWLAFIVAGVVLGLEDRTIVHKAIFYATIEHDALNLWSSIICAIFEVAVLTLEAVAATILIRHWRAFRALSHSSTRLDDLAPYPDPPPLSSSQPVSTTAPTTGGRKTTLRGAGRTARFADRFEGVNLGLVFRVGFFGLLVLMALIVAVLVADEFTSPAGDLAVASIPPAVFVLFASQDDVLVAWRLKARRGHSSGNFGSHSLSGGGPSTTSRPPASSSTGRLAHAGNRHQRGRDGSDSTLDLGGDGPSISLAEMDGNESTDHIWPSGIKTKANDVDEEGEGVDVLRYERGGSNGKHGRGSGGGGGKGRKLAVWVHTERQTWSDGASGHRQLGGGV